MRIVLTRKKIIISRYSKTGYSSIRVITEKKVMPICAWCENACFHILNKRTGNDVQHTKKVNSYTKNKSK